MKQRALIILVAILGATCIVLGIFLLRGGKQPETADPTPEATATAIPTATPEAVSSASTDSAVPYVSPIDFASLQKENPDIYAWLYIPGTEFDFPILQRAGDDDYYLTHDSDGNDNSMGAIFSESSYNDGKMDDPATVLYGHQMLGRHDVWQAAAGLFRIECADGARRYHRVSAGKGVALQGVCSCAVR